MSVQNQKIIKINKAPFGKDSTNTRWIGVSYDAAMMAANNLNVSGLRMWLYLVGNMDNYTLELSRQACANVGISKDTYYRGIEELEKKRYLVPTGDNETFYSFYDIPPVAN